MASKRVLCLISEFGYWGEELIGPVHMLDAAGYAIDFITPTGKRPVPLPPSIDPAYIDPPLGRAVTDELTATRTKEIDKSTRLDDPISLKAWFPERPYRSEADFLRQQEAYYLGLDGLSAEVDGKYDAERCTGRTLDLARGMGVPGLRVETPDQIASAVREMLATDGPFLVDLVITSDIPSHVVCPESGP